MFQVSQSPPVLLTYALFAIKFLESVPLLLRGLSQAGASRRKCAGVVSAYGGRLKWLRLLALLRPRVMIITGLWLGLIFVWFILIIFSFSYPDWALSRRVAVTYPYSVWVSLGTLLIATIIIVGTLFSFARVYDLFRFILPQPQGRLASRIDRGDEGYFYVDEEKAMTIVAYIITHVLSNPNWYDQSEVYRPSVSEGTSATYANFVFFAALVDARAGVGAGMDRWNWITSVYRATPDLFSTESIKQLTTEGQFGRTLVTELVKHSGAKEVALGDLREALDSAVKRLGKKFKYDTRNIGEPNFWHRLRIKAKLFSTYALVKRRIIKFDVYDQLPAEANTVLLIKLMAIRGIWNIDWKELEFPFSPWQCVFLLRSGILETDLTTFSSWDTDFNWFKNDALKKVSALVEKALGNLEAGDKTKIEETLKSEISFSSATILADTFLWMVGSRCCRYNNCREVRNEKGLLCPLGAFGICEPEAGKKLFTFEEPNFVLK